MKHPMSTASFSTEKLLEKMQQWSSRLSIKKQFGKCSVVGVPCTINNLSRFRLYLMALHKNTSCRQILQNHLIKCFCKTWLQLVFLRRPIRERQRWGKILAAKMSLSLTKNVHRRPQLPVLLCINVNFTSLFGQE